MCLCFLLLQHYYQNKLKLAIIGQSLFGQEVYSNLRKQGHKVVGVFTVPDKDGKADPLGEFIPLSWFSHLSVWSLIFAPPDCVHIAVQLDLVSFIWAPKNTNFCLSVKSLCCYLLDLKTQSKSRTGKENNRLYELRQMYFLKPQPVEQNILHSGLMHSHFLKSCLSPSSFLGCGGLWWPHVPDLLWVSRGLCCGWGRYMLTLPCSWTKACL